MYLLKLDLPSDLPCTAVFAIYVYWSMFSMICY